MASKTIRVPQSLTVATWWFEINQSRKTKELQRRLVWQVTTPVRFLARWDWTQSSLTEASTTGGIPCADVCTVAFRLDFIASTIG